MVLHIQAFPAGLVCTMWWVCNVYWCKSLPDGGLLLAQRNHPSPKMTTGSRTLRLAQARNKKLRRSNPLNLINDIGFLFRDNWLHSMHLNGLRRGRSASTACPDGYFGWLHVETLVPYAKSTHSLCSMFRPSSSPVVVVISSAGVCPSVIGPSA